MRTNNRSIIVRLRSRQNKFSPKLQQLAEYVISHPNDVQLQSITDLANRSNTSDATVFRLCKELGYSGYAQFKMALAVELSQPKSGEPTETGNTSITNICADNAIRALKDTALLLNQAQLEQVVEYIHHARMIYCIGVAASNVVSRYLAYRLLRLGKPVICYEDTHLAAMQAAVSSKEDCWFIVSSAGSSREVVYSAELAYQRDVPVIGLSNILHSPLAKVSNIILAAANPEGPLSGGAFASKVGVMLIIDSLLSHLIARYPEYKEKIRTTAEETSPLLL